MSILQNIHKNVIFRTLKENAQCKDEDKRIIVLSISPQAILSISTRYNLDPREGLEKTVGKEGSICVAFDIK